MDNSVIDKLLNKGERQIPLELIKELGEPSKIKLYYESKGWEIVLEDDTFVFSGKDKRSLLLG